MTAATLPSPRLPLRCHPATPCPLALQIEASLALAGSAEGPGVLLRYELRGDLAGLRLPAPAAPGPADGLWQHTCLEAFVGVADDPAYREFNFSPSGQWAAYRFSDQRQRAPENDGAAPLSALAPEMNWVASPDALTLTAWLPLALLPRPAPGRSLEWGLTAVIETTDHQLSYWALHHPQAKPDFHHRGGFSCKPDLPY